MRSVPIIRLRRMLLDETRFSGIVGFADGEHEMAYTFKKQNAKLIGVYRGGQFVCWLEQGSHRKTGLSTKRETFWSCVLNGVEIKASSLTSTKQRIEGKADIKTGRPI